MDFPNISIYLIIWSTVLIYITFIQAKKYNEIQQNKRELENNQRLLDQETKKSADLIKEKREEVVKKQQVFKDFKLTQKEELERLLEEVRELKNELGNGFLKGRRWLAKAFSEYVSTKDTELECALVIKPNPGWKSAEIVSTLKKSRKEIIERLKFLEYQLISYEEYFPELVYYKDAILDEVVDFRSNRIEDNESIDPALKFGLISKEEYEKLPSSEKYQLALDRYWKKNKTKVEIGRLYERYIGFLFEKKGWNVSFVGIIKGFEDFGRDLICRKGNETLIIQCKCWAKTKVIREKYIMQLFGTSILYEYENAISSVKPLIFATTELSEEAKVVASRLGVKFENEQLKKYPMIKCNINTRNKEKIYHLPFDQQYDKIVIGDQKGEFYAMTVKEAEENGFRRAFRWTGI